MGERGRRGERGRGWEAKGIHVTVFFVHAYILTFWHALNQSSVSHFELRLWLCGARSAALVPSLSFELFPSLSTEEEPSSSHTHTPSSIQPSIHPSTSWSFRGAKFWWQSENRSHVFKCALKFWMQLESFECHWMTRYSIYTYTWAHTLLYTIYH